MKPIPTTALSSMETEQAEQTGKGRRQLLASIIICPPQCTMVITTLFKKIRHTYSMAAMDLVGQTLKPFHLVIFFWKDESICKVLPSPK